MCNNDATNISTFILFDWNREDSHDSFFIAPDLDH